MANDDLKATFEAVQTEAVQLAGGLHDLAQRATVYHHIARHSGGNHLFPLIAAHGALWARGYFRFGLRLGQLLSWQYARQPAVRRAHLDALGQFADALREINRRVCVDTYANYHFTARYGNHPEAARYVPAELLEALNRVHAARRAGRALSLEEKRAVFDAHFLHEQRTVVGDHVQTAVAAFDWPLVKRIALRPVIRFAYFPARQCLWFRNFSSMDERIEKGRHAFELAAAAGMPAVEQALHRYHVLPPAFFAQPVEYFAGLRTAVLAG